MPPIVAKYDWTLDALSTAFRWHFRHRTRPISHVAFWAMSLLFIVWGAVVTASFGQLDGLILIALGSIFILWHVAGPRLLAWLQLRRNPHLNAHIEWQFADDAIEIISPLSSTKTQWAAAVKAVKTPDGFLIYFSPQMFHWIPRTGFASSAEFETVRQLAKTKCANFIDTDEKHLWPRIRFRVANLLWTMFWVCIWGGAFAYFKTFVEANRPLQGLPWNVLLSGIVVLWTPAIAIGAFFGHAKRGALIGLGILAILGGLVFTVVG
jgi:hypothetical protein